MTNQDTARRQRTFKRANPKLTAQILTIVHDYNASGMMFAQLQKRLIGNFSERAVYNELQRLRCEGKVYHHRRTGWHLAAAEESSTP